MRVAPLLFMSLHVLAEVPAVGVDGLGLVGDGGFDLFSLVAVAGEGGAVGIVGGVGGVVVAEVHDDPVAGLDLGEDFGPCAFFDIAAAAAAAEGIVVDVDLGCVEHGDDLVAPAPWAVFAVAGAGADDGVADEEEGGMLSGGLDGLGLRGVGDCRRLRESDGRDGERAEGGEKDLAECAGLHG